MKEEHPFNRKCSLPGTRLIICEVNPGHRVSAEFAVLKLEFGVLNNDDWLNMLMSYVHNMPQSGR